MNKPLFKEAIILLCLVFALNKIGLRFDLYVLRSPLPEYDSIVHFAAGICLTLGVLWFYFFSGLFEPKERRYKDFLLMALLGVIFIGTVWEIFELLVGVTSAGSSGYLRDTSLDFLFDTLGGVAACIYAYNIEKKLKNVTN